jgi:hypothetical protein
MYATLSQSERDRSLYQLLNHHEKLFFIIQHNTSSEQSKRGVLQFGSGNILGFYFRYTYDYWFYDLYSSVNCTCTCCYSLDRPTLHWHQHRSRLLKTVLMQSVSKILSGASISNYNNASIIMFHFPDWNYSCSNVSPTLNSFIESAWVSTKLNVYIFPIG